jgi:predicted 2-oxoglutarate/Fe(II)-dependent dioxygenase YbiX
MFGFTNIHIKDNTVYTEMSTYYFPRYVEPRVVKSFISHEECDYLITMARDKTSDSKVGNNILDKSLRKSKTYRINPDDEDEIVTKIRKKCSQISTFPYNYTEFQITHYDTGGYYGPHHDRADRGPISKRVCTIIIALNDDYEGGETNFIYLYKSFKMKKGDAIFFYTADQLDRHTDFAMHEGAEVTSGEKWIANIWIHNIKQFKADNIK